jgi:serine/threonine-protein kinase
MVFDAATPTAYALAHVQTPPPPMSERSELPVPAALQAIVMQLLAKNPDHRVQSARELARRLRALPDVDAWTPERAEQWWETNLPDLTLQEPVEDEALEAVTAEQAHA